jgi:CBS domain-containing protein
MKVSQAMTRDAKVARPDDTIQAIAKFMAERDIGFMPVGDDDRLLGTITDRDIAVRAVAQGRDGKTKVQEVMTRDIKYCFDDEDLDHVIQNMGDIQVRRLPVVNRDKRLVGVISLADAVQAHDPEAVGIAMSGIVEPGGQHNQKGDGRAASR